MKSKTKKIIIIVTAIVVFYDYRIYFCLEVA